MHQACNLRNTHYPLTRLSESRQRLRFIKGSRAVVLRSQAYLLYYPELQRKHNVNTEKQAKHHYLSVGRTEGRVYKRLRVLLRYTASTGLINQQYSHIAAFALATALGAEIVLPPAVKRDSFAHYFSTFKEENEVNWTAAPLESLLDVDSIINFWRGRGLPVHKTPSLASVPDLTQPETAFPLYPVDDMDPRFATRLGDVYLQNLDMPELIDKARLAVLSHASAVLRRDPDSKLDAVALDLPCSFFMLRSLSNLRVVTEVAKSLAFAPQIHALADRIILGMAAQGAEVFNAVHLRIEKDARDWSTIMGGDAVVWHYYVMAMKKASFSGSVALYAASGLLSYEGYADMLLIVKSLRSQGLCSRIFYKELFLSHQEIEGLNSEQKALVDFLVLAQGRAFVGFGSSTFSFYLREYRALHNIPRSSSVLVDASAIGTDELFNSAGTVI
ncbi:hypothetical protein WJX73_009533 [Symbiochloris irregularis]|uniref:O-fucosyltransferase family protein n=1 Tax=Symbiochloris irregularis TaxID=706552 RepID=A0AAW1NII9_9CHLO